MYVSKLRALTSDESGDSEDSANAQTITREALEQNVISQYQEVLQLEKSGQWHTSEEILRKLINSDVLTEVQARDGEKTQSALLHLKYAVTKNLGLCLIKQSKLQEGLEFYVKAAKIDDSDLNLWFKIGVVAMQIPDLNMAATAFEEALRCSPNHWPSIDNLITVLYAMGDYLSCLYFISKGLSLDDGYMKGHAFKDKIFHTSSSLRTDFFLFYPHCSLPDSPAIASVDKSKIDLFYSEADSLTEKSHKKWERPLLKPSSALILDRSESWLQLVRCLLCLLQSTREKQCEKLVFQTVELQSSSEGSSPIEVRDYLTDEESEEEPSQTPQHRPGQDEEDQGKGRSLLLEKLICSQKRRSARVRSTARREEPSLARSLAQLIPHDLLPREDKKEEGYGFSEDSLQTMDLYRIFESKYNCDDAKQISKMSPSEREKIISEQQYFNTSQEHEDINKILEKVEKNNLDLIDLMKEFLLRLASKWNLIWPDYLAKYYVKVFQATMEYEPPGMRSLLASNDDEDMVILLYGELLLDQWLCRGKKKGRPSPLGNSALGGDFSTLFLGKLQKTLLTSEDIVLHVRILWLEANLFLHVNDVESAALALNRILHHESLAKVEVNIPNLYHNSKVTDTIVSELLSALYRNKSLSEVLDLYSEGLYEEVTEILTESLSAEVVSGEVNETVLSREMQFALILDSYWKLSKYKECLRWSEYCLRETVAHYRSCSDDDRPYFSSVIVSTLQGIITCVEAVGCIIFETLPPEKRTRLIQSLSNIICIQMDAPENSSEMPIESVAPWILLHHIIKYHEESKKKKQLKIGTALSNPEEEELPPSTHMLFQGHEYLGRRSWCCFDEGALLFHTLAVIYPIMQSLPYESESLTTINHQVEQIFYCLYGQHKKNKGRHIIDHNVMGLAMTWNRAQQVFVFTRPRELPSYDSSGRCSISNDTEYLYSKLIKLVPEDCNPARLVEEVNKYIAGEIIEVPKNDNPLPRDIEDIYYLLAHFYFKSKSWNKALKYYLLDVCANPDRVDSWACLALARGSQIETKLNSCETIKSEQELLTNASMVCKCYERALQLDPSQNTLWIERGSFSYAIHSFCSNLLKKELNLSLEMFHNLEKQKELMISAAYECFVNANKLWYSCGGKDMQDERWLHHYMLGKIAAKKDQEPKVYVGHYLKALDLLHEIGASYPSHVTYSAPQYLAVEAVELYYRVHACILKFIKLEDDILSKENIQYFKYVITKMARSPFISLVTEVEKPEKVKKPKKTIDSDDETLSVCAEVKDVMQDILGKVEINNLKRKAGDGYHTTDSDEAPTKFLKLESELKKPVEAKEDGEKKPGPVIKRDSSSSNKKTSDSSSDSDSSCSSSSSSSSSSTSSDSDSSDSESGQESAQSDNSRHAKKVKTQKEKADEICDWKQEQDWLVKRSLEAMELCAKRFPEHYKCLYHLAHFYSKSKAYKDNRKVYQLLLGPGGLFSDRRSTNFFNGIWRIPNNEIDRPGSFAAHMGRCIHLLLDLLRETKDYRMLLDLGLQLKLVPEADKKYLRDNEREELYKEAVTLSAQTLRKKLQEINDSLDLKSFLLEVYHVYKKGLKSNLKEPMFASILVETFSKLTSSKVEGTPSLEMAQKFCLTEIAAMKQAAAAVSSGQPLSFQTPKTSQVVETLPTPPPAHQASSISTSTPTSSKALEPPLPSHHSTPPVMGPPPSSRRGRGGAGPRKPRGRPPGSLSAPRIPRMPTNFSEMIAQGFSQYHMYPSDMSMLSLQNEILKRCSIQNAELHRIMARAQQGIPSTSQAESKSNKHVTSSVIPSQLAISSSKSSAVDHTKSVKQPLVKDRPNLSITPVKRVKSPSNKSGSSPISVSVQKYGKNQNKSKAAARGSKLQVSILPVNQGLNTSRNSVISQSHVMNPLPKGLQSGALSISTRPADMASQRKQAVSIIPKSGAPSTSSPFGNHHPPSVIHPPITQKASPTAAPPSDHQAQSSEPSLQHKILSAKKLAAPGASGVKRKGDEMKPLHLLPETPYPDPKRTVVEVPLSSSSLLKQAQSHSQSHYRPAPPSTFSQARMNLFDSSLSITQTSVSSRTDSFRPNRGSMPPVSTKAPLPQPLTLNHPSSVPLGSQLPVSSSYSSHILDKKHKLLQSVPNLDSSVAETIRNFGSSITITPSTPPTSKAAKAHTMPQSGPSLHTMPNSLPSKQTSMIQSSSPKGRIKEKKMDCEVIILDD